MMRYVNSHAPAMLPQEAAMLTALPATAARAGRLMMPVNESHFVPVGTVEEPQPVTSTQRCGSVAGRAVLSAAGISLPGVQGMSRGCRRYQDRQQANVACVMVWL